MTQANERLDAFTRSVNAEVRRAERLLAARIFDRLDEESDRGFEALASMFHDPASPSVVIQRPFGISPPFSSDP